MKPRLCRFSWRAIESLTRPCLVLLLLGRVSLHVPPSSPWNLPFLLRSPPFPSHPLPLIPLFLAKVRLSLTFTSSHLTIWCSGQTALFLFSFGKGGSSVVYNCSLCSSDATLFSDFCSVLPTLSFLPSFLLSQTL